MERVDHVVGRGRERERAEKTDENIEKVRETEQKQGELEEEESRRRKFANKTYSWTQRDTEVRIHFP